MMRRVGAPTSTPTGVGGENEKARHTLPDKECGGPEVGTLGR